MVSITNKLLAAVMILALNVVSAFADIEYADFSTWVAGSTNQTIQFPTQGSVTVSNITNMASGFPQYYLETFSNPSAPITGTVDELWVSEVVGTTATIRFDFSNSLNSTSRIILDDVDLNESVSFQAFDASNNLLSLSGWDFAKFDIHPGDDGTGPLWSVNGGGTTGTLQGDGLSTDQWAAFFAPALGQEVARIDFTFTGVNGGFEFAFAAQSVPEPNIVSLAGLAAASLACLRRRRICHVE